LALGRAEDALEAVEAAFDQKPTSSRAHVLRAQALIRLKRYSEAVDATNLALQHDPSNDAALLCKVQALIEGQIDQSQAKRLLEHYVRAANSNDAAVKSASDLILVAREEDGNAHYFLAHLYRALGHAELAMDEVNRALELGLSNANYADAPAQELKGELMAAEGKQEEAAQWLYTAGRTFYWHDEHVAAIRILTRVAKELNPDNVEAYWYVADALRLQSYQPGQLLPNKELVEEAIAYWEAGAAKQFPTESDSWAYVARAVLCEAQMAGLEANYLWGLRWEAITYLERALLLQEVEPLRWAYLARYHRNSDNLSACYQAGNKGIIYGAEDPLAWSEWLLTVATIGQYSAAEEALAKRRTLEPHDPWVDAVEAQLSLLLGKHKQALDLINKIIKEAPENGEYRYIRALSYQLLGFEKQARRDYSWIWTHPDSVGAMDQHTVGLAAYSLGKTDQAIAIFNAVGNTKGHDASAVNANLALCYLTKGDLELGVQHLNHGIEIAKTPSTLDLIDIDLQVLEQSSNRLDRGAQIREVLERARRKLTEQRSRLENLPSAEEELTRITTQLENTDHNGWPWFGARAGLARLYTETGQWREAVAEYETIRQRDSREGPRRFPEVDIGLERARAKR
jgi:Tfp pilus assembly protein PilF